MHFGKFTGADLRLFLRIVGIFQREEKEFIESVHEDSEKLLGPEAISVYWCNFYEKPFIEHLGALVGALGFGDAVKEIFDRPKPMEAMAEIIDGAGVELA